MTQPITLLSADDFFRSYSHRGGRYELVKGEVIEMPPAGIPHAGIAVHIASPLYTFVRQHKLGWVGVEGGFRLASSPDTLRAPDVAFIRKDRIPEGGLPGTFFNGAPDLAVEVVSPSDTADELEVKVRDYLKAGSQQVWVVYPNSRTVVVYLSEGGSHCYSEGDIIGGGDLLPGFTLPVAEVFAV